MSHADDVIKQESTLDVNTDLPASPEGDGSASYASADKPDPVPEGPVWP